MGMLRALAAGLLMLLAAPVAAKTPKVGQPAPPFEMTLVDGSKVMSADLKGQVVVLTFWATWCAPCRQELPLLDSYYRILQSKGLRVFAVATEGSLPEKVLRPLFANLAISSVRRIRGIADTVPAVPTNYVIDRGGTVRYAKAASLDLDALNREIIPLLNEAAPNG